jgi:hypothetical protein
MSILAAWQALLNAEGFTVTSLPDRPALAFRFVTEEHAFGAMAIARESARQALFYAYAPFPVPPSRRAVVAAFLHRANYGLLLGNFELDMDDGEVRFKASVDLEGLTPEGASLHNLLATGLLTMDRYLVGLAAVVFDGLDDRAGIAVVEEGR